jgi:CRP/FNR family transcriptional regulator, cyclic AMP receptor protein
MGQREDLVNRLRQVRCLADCSDDELASINELMREVSIDAGETLTRQGEIGTDFVMIMDGHASVARDGQEIAGVMEGSFVGELSLLDHTSQTATVTAMTPLRACVLDATEFQSLLERAPTLRGKIEAAAADRRPS